MDNSVSYNQLTHRNSSIELLKIFSILLIIISHVTQTLGYQNELIANQNYLINLKSSTTDITTLFLVLLRHLGCIGNSIFFVCSAWFLLDSKEVKTTKLFQIIINVIFISLAILVPVYIIRNGNIPLKIIIRQFFPITFANNWYLTCYILFYPIHPYLNKIIKGMTSMELFKSTVILNFLYVFLNSIFDGLFMASPLILWVTIYFTIAYIKLYVPKLENNIKLNLFVLVTSIFGLLSLIIITNYLGLRYSFSNQNLHWASNNNPFAITFALSLFLIVKNNKLAFTSRFVNYIATLTIFIYLIHENFLIRRFYRPIVWQYIHDYYGYEHIILYLFFYVMILFLISTLISALYQLLTRAVVNKLSIMIDLLFGKFFNYLHSKVRKFG